MYRKFLMFVFIHNGLVQKFINSKFYINISSVKKNRFQTSLNLKYNLKIKNDKNIAFMFFNNLVHELNLRCICVLRHNKQEIKRNIGIYSNRTWHKTFKQKNFYNFSCCEFCTSSLKHD